MILNPDDVPDLDAPPPLSPPRFSLRTLLLVMALFGAVLAATLAMGPLPTAMLVLLALAIAAHVAGNALGTQLRDHRRSQPAPVRDPAPAPRMETTNLSTHQGLGWPLVAAIGSGALAGVGMGILVFGWLTQEATREDLLLGSLTFGALGAMAGFLSGSFLQVLFRAWHQANEEGSSRNSHAGDSQSEARDGALAASGNASLDTPLEKAPPSSATASIGSLADTGSGRGDSASGVDPAARDADSSNSCSPPHSSSR